MPLIDESSRDRACFVGVPGRLSWAAWLPVSLSKAGVLFVDDSCVAGSVVCNVVVTIAVNVTVNVAVPLLLGS